MNQNPNANEELDADTYDTDEDVHWLCDSCGHLVDTLDAADVCPKCGEER